MTLDHLQKSCRLKTLSALRRASKRIDQSPLSLTGVCKNETIHKLEIAKLILLDDPNEKDVYLRHFAAKAVVVALAKKGILTVFDLITSDVRDIRKTLRDRQIEMPIVLRCLHPEK